MKIFKNLATRFDKPVTVEYAKNYLRSKGIATSECGEHSISFKLYDMSWDLNVEDGRFGLRNFFNLGNDIQMDCMMRAVNHLNKERWVIKSFIDTYTPNDENGNPVPDATIASVVFSFENFCYSESAFDKIYEFAIFAMCDGIEFHRQCYGQYMNEKSTQAPTTKIGFHTNSENKENVTVAVDQQSKRRIGFIQ